MAKKQKGFIASFVKKHVAKRNPEEAIKSSKLYEDALTYIAPAAIGYIAARAAGRLARNVLGKRFNNPLFLKPIQILGNAATLAVLWYGASKISALRKYRLGLISGAGVAVVQSLVEFLMPKINFLFDAPVQQVYIPASSGGDNIVALEPMDPYPDEDGVPADQLEGDDENVDMDELQTGVFAN
ncbi:MAG: hypothetical protein AAB922_06655 [Patescibacteria group bacterium]